MGITDNWRPGVYSRYDVTSGHSSPRSASYAALVAAGAEDLAGEVHALGSYGQALELLGAGEENRRLLNCCKILFDSGVSKVLCSVVKEDYAAALALVEREDNIRAVVSDASEKADLALVKASVEASAGGMRERMAFVGAEADAAEDAAAALNSERVALCTPAVSPTGREERGAVYAACAMAGLVLAANDPAANWNGAALSTVESPDPLGEQEIQDLIAGGVTVLERVGEGVECIRPVTTKATTGGGLDNSLRPLNTILIIDDVIVGLRNGLKTRLSGLRISSQSMESIRAQVVVELSAKQDEGIIESFEAPVVRAGDSDPTVCVVELTFQVAHVVSQIHITAHVRV